MAGLALGQLHALVRTISSAMKRVLILSFSVVRNDPRVMRQVTALEGRYGLTVAGFGTKPPGVFQFNNIEVTPNKLSAKTRNALLLLTNMNEEYYQRMPAVRKSVALFRTDVFDLVIANDLSTVGAALIIAKGAPVLVDAHEYSPREFEDLRLWRLFHQRFNVYLCERYLPRVADMTTVCEGIAREYRQFGVDPAVVFNCPAFHELPVRRVRRDKIRLVHHGAPIPSRKLELTLKMMKYLDERYTLDLMLTEGNPTYLRRLRKLASGDGRIRFREAVPMDQIVTTIHDYDVGVCYLPPVNFNYQMALPNKFFEYVQARLAVAIGPSPEMASIARRYGFGIVSRSFDPCEMARDLASRSPGEIEALKRRADVAATELNAERSYGLFAARVERLLN